MFLAMERSMLRNLAWQATDTLARAQLAVFHGLGDQIRLSEEDRRRVLNLDDQGWTAWSDFLADGPLPAEPPLPEMLRRLGETAFALSMLVERRASA
jgi:hypothetical protein